MKKEISNCCKATVHVGGDDREGTHYYVCNECGNPCDLFVEQDTSKKKHNKDCTCYECEQEFKKRFFKQNTSDNQEEWEKEFDEKFDDYLFTPQNKKEIMIDVRSEDVKDFIRTKLEQCKEEKLASTYQSSKVYLMGYNESKQETINKIEEWVVNNRMDIYGGKLSENLLKYDELIYFLNTLK